MPLLSYSPPRRAAAGVLNAAVRGGLVGLALLAPTVPLAAQQRHVQLPAPERPTDGHGGVAPVAPPRFQLFGNADIAYGSLRYTGNNIATFTNFEPCQQTTNARCGWSISPTNSSAAQQQFFMWSIAAGAGVSDFRKIRQVHPGVNNMQGPPGYAYIGTADIVAQQRRWGARDASLGSSFSGVTSLTSGGTCRNRSVFSSGWLLSANLSLLPMSDCPETWATARYDGPTRVPAEGFLADFQRSPNEFHFEWQKVPRSRRDTTATLGAYSLYSELQDYNRDLLPLYGSVTPQGNGTPTAGGFPLGLDVRMDAFNFNVTELANTIFFRMTIVNNSGRVYGSGVNYDSLYFGLTPGFINNQRGVYYDPARNTVWGIVSGHVAACNGGIVPSGVQACNPVATGGLRAQSGVAITVLQSPIGDERNKLLSKAGGPFYAPTSPFRDDTITINHGHHCGYIDCDLHTLAINTRRGFGMLSSTEANVLDGRDPATLSQFQMWRTFRNRNYNGTVSADVAKFNRFVPGASHFGQWDYDNDGKQDTLYLDTCAENGCVAVMGDTMPGKQVIGYSNVNGIMSAGPFKLAHGDTTGWVFAITFANDSATLFGNVESLRAAYMNFFLGPEAPPPPAITSFEVRSTQVADAQNLLPQVRLFFSSAPEEWKDPYLTQYAADLAAATDSTRIILRTLNPGLVGELQTAATRNFGDLLVFKSCDGGLTFTSDNDCDSDITLTTTGGGGQLAFGAYGRFTADANGQITNVFVDDNVQGGRTYLYSLVPRSRGFRRAVTIRSPGSSVLRDTILVVADTLANVIARTGPSTATVYVPVSLPAGAGAPQAIASTVGGNARLPVVTRVGQNARTGRYRLIFGNRFTVTIRTTLATGQAQSTVIVRDAYAAASVNGAAATNFAVDSTVLSGPGRVDISGATPTFTTTTDAAVRTETATFTATLGYVLAGADGTPFFISTDLTAAGSTPQSFLGRKDFPGFVVELVQANADVLTTEQTVRPNGDTLIAAVRNSSTLQWRQEESTRLSGRGVYEFRFGADAFGPNAPFTITTPQATEQAVLASLAARPATSTATTDANAIATVRAAITGLATTNFVAMKFPFTAVGPDGRPLILVAPHRATLPAAQRFTTILLGNGPDTARVTLPTDTWVPGDRFYVLQEVLRDSVAGGATVIRDTTIGGQVTKRPIQVRDTVVAFGPASLGCNNPRTTCNPLAFDTRGATGYLALGEGWKIVIDYPEPFTIASEVQLDVQGPTPPAGQIAKSVLRQVRVVPNPYVVLSDFDAVTNRVGESRLLFTGVPVEGSMRIYSVSGQFLQQLRWTAADLNGTGDLAYNLRTREGTDLASGLYIYVLTPGGANAGSSVVRGKFTVIR
jgi:hypothetical protein